MIDKQTLVEQQDSLLEFPCDFPIKVMGASIPHFAETIGAAVRELVPDFDPKTINERKSNGGNTLLSPSRCMPPAARNSTVST